MLRRKHFSKISTALVLALLTVLLVGCGKIGQIAKPAEPTAEPVSTPAPNEPSPAPVTTPETLPVTLGLGRLKRTKSEDLEVAVRARFATALPAEEVDRLVRLALAIRARRGLQYDELCRETGFGYADVARLAGQLEEERFIDIDLLQRCTINVKIG